MTMRFLLILILFSPGLLTAAQTSGSCIKSVFKHYCLGGNLSHLLRQYPADTQPISNGERRGVIYTKGRERVYVMAYQEHIYKILHTYEPVNQVTFKDLHRHLQEKYGQPQDHSRFPEYVRNMAGKIGAIRRGEGELKYVWQLPGEAWRVELAWIRKLGVSISYLANELDARQRNDRLEGL